MACIWLSFLIFIGVSQGFCLCREIFVSPSGADSPNCRTKDNPCLTIEHALKAVAATNDVIRMDGSSANFTVRGRLKISKPINITFSSYNGIAWICGSAASAGDGFARHLMVDVFAARRNDVYDITFRAINFCNIRLLNVGRSYLSAWSDHVEIRVKVEECNFYFSYLNNVSKEQLFARSLFALQFKASVITIDNCRINANYQIGILFLSSDLACSGLRSSKIAFKNTKIENAKYAVYAILQKCTDKLSAKSFKLKIVNSTFRSDGQQQSRFPQFAVVVGKLFRNKIWSLIYIKNSRFENLSVLTQTGAVMDIRGPSIAYIRNCTFIGNVGNRGGALAFQSSFVELTDCHFYNNIAKMYSICAHTDQGGNGGAVFAGGLYGPMQLRVQNCSFINNSANCFGSAFYAGYFSSISVRNTQFSTFAGRRTTSQALWVSYSDNLMLDNVTFEAEEIQRVNGILFFARSKVFNFGKKEPFFKCPVGSILNASSYIMNTPEEERVKQVECQSCPEKTYTLKPSSAVLRNIIQGIQKNRPTKCRECCFGATCNKGIKPNPNFWGYVHKDSATMLVCPPGYCCQSQSECAALDSCNGMRTGRMCGKCREGHFQSIFTSDCLHKRNCKPGKFWALFILCCMFFTVLFCFLQDIFSIIVKIFSSKKGLPSTKKGLRRLVGALSCLQHWKREANGHDYQNGNQGGDQIETREGLINDEAEDRREQIVDEEENMLKESEPGSKNNSMAGGLIKIVFFFYQVHSILTVYKSNKEIQYLSHIQRFLRGIFNLDLQTTSNVQLHCPLQGMNSTTKVLIRGLFPINCLILAVLFYCMIKIISSYFKNSDFVQTYSLKAKPRFLTAILQLILLGYSTMTSSILTLLTCLHLVTGETILYIDGSVSCYQSWQYATLAFVLCWSLPLIYALHKLPKYMKEGEIGVKGFYAALLLPLPFIVYSIIKDGKRLIKYFQSKGNHTESHALPTSTSNIPERDADAIIHQLLNVLGGPFRSVGEKDQERKLSWEPVLLLQRIFLLLCHALVLPPGRRSLFLLLLIIIFSKLNVLYRPFNSVFLNTLNGLIFILLCITGIINAFYAFIYEYGVVPEGPISQLLDIFDYIEVTMLLIFPFLAALTLFILAVAKVIFLIFSLARCIRNRCNCREIAEE